MYRYLSAAAAAIVALSSPALASAAVVVQTAQAIKPAPARQLNATRAAMLKSLDANFKAIDTNGDGALNAAELGAAEGKIQQQRLTQLRNRFEADFAKLDTNKDGQLSKAEFMAAAPRTAATPPNGANIVGQLDKNKDGKISAEEYRTPILARFDAIDSNHDGAISIAERQAAQSRQQKR